MLLTKDLVQWIAKNAKKESAFLYPDAQWNIDVYGLLDYIRTQCELEETIISKWVDEIQDATVN